MQNQRVGLDIYLDQSSTPTSPDSLSLLQINLPLPALVAGQIFTGGISEAESYSRIEKY
jgi:hypothetical protein